MIYKLFPRLKVQPLSEDVRSRDAFVYLDRGMQVVGWVPPKNKILQRFYAIWTVLLVGLVFCWSPMGFSFTYAREMSTFTAGEFLTSIQIGLNTYGNTLKSSYTFWGTKRYKLAKELLDRMDKRCTTEEEQAGIRRSVARWNLCYMIYQISYSVYTTSTFVVATVNGHLPWRFYNPLIDSTKNVLFFWIAALMEYFLMSMTVLADQCADVYPIAYMGVMRTHMNFLKQRITRLRTNPELSEDENYQELVKCIKDHQIIMEYVEIMRPVISATIFVQFLLIGVVLGLSMINILFFSDFWACVANVMFVGCVLMETFPFCYLSNIIMDDAAELSDCLFQSNWIDANRRYKTAVISFMHRIQQPIIIIAGGVFIICLQTNITVAKLAFSVITVVKQMDFAKKFG
ncbi:uncharacterized protein Dwil_GK14943 [Drosophila willistoni]|uniref:Odorant receptor n=1 Tax=Drosophila willistoni TaxID=7260 RepID=B4MW55_DROWI|nr:odorant receptor 22b [Drosophila willistoni]EDW75925.1 uncharacterized protein Dwil_GK14943 [Drosophila willistoni]